MLRSFLAASLMLGAVTSASAAPAHAPAEPPRVASNPSMTVFPAVIAIEKSALQVRRDEEADRAKAVSDDKASDYSRWAMYGTCAAAVIAALQAGFFFWQLRLMRRTADDAADAARAARVSADVARDTFTKLERPWIFLEGVRMEWRDRQRPRVPNNFYVSLKFKNNGRTPALINRLDCRLVKTDELPEVPDYTRCDALFVVPAKLAADCDFETNQIGPKPGEDVEMTIYGRLTYTDMVGTEHHTGFAMNMSPWMPASSTNANRAYDSHD